MFKFYHPFKGEIRNEKNPITSMDVNAAFVKAGILVVILSFLSFPFIPKDTPIWLQMVIFFIISVLTMYFSGFMKLVNDISETKHYYLIKWLESFKQ